MKPVIGVVTRPLKDDANRNNIQMLDVSRQAIIRNNGIPIGINPTQDIDYHTTDIPKLTREEKDDIVRQIELCDGILLQGGLKWYEYDEFITDYCITNNIPSLYMCMSMQLLGARDLGKDESSLIRVEGHKSEEKYAHNIIIDKASLLYEILGKQKIKVNSRHSYALSSTNELLISGRSEDGVIEAVERKDKKFVLGVQWHPEMMSQYDEDQNKILKYFIDKAKSR